MILLFPNSLQTFSFTGPFPGLAFLESVPIAALALVIHGVGTAAAFLATLLGMLESTKKGGIPHTDQTTVS